MMKPEKDELELAIRARSGDPVALAELIERLRLGLFALAYTELRHREDAQDAVAAALYQICCHAVDLRDPASMRAWMYTIVRNQTRRMSRGKQARSTVLDEAVTVRVEDPSPVLRLDIERALRQLPRDQARAVNLFYLRGWTIEEIARSLVRPEGTIKRWLYQGRQRLAAQMKGYYPMEKTWKACVVAPEITPDQLQTFTDALKAAGYAEVHNVAEVRCIGDLYQMNTTQHGVSGMEPGLIRLVGEGKSNQIDKSNHMNGQVADPSIIQLAEPLASSDFLLLGQQIAGHSAFEVMTLLRAILPTLPVCLLLDTPAPDSTVFASWVGGFSLSFTVDAHGPVLQQCFAKVRMSIEPN
jgi:RNA polymerase sigma-70 factor (ECF subfamily)